MGRSSVSPNHTTLGAAARHSRRHFGGSRRGTSSRRRRASRTLALRSPSARRDGDRRWLPASRCSPSTFCVASRKLSPAAARASPARVPRVRLHALSLLARSRRSARPAPGRLRSPRTRRARSRRGLPQAADAAEGRHAALAEIPGAGEHQHAGRGRQVGPECTIKLSGPVKGADAAAGR